MTPTDPMTRYGDPTAAAEAATNPPCGQCWSMATWLSPGGPDEVALRLRVMLALVDVGRAEVVPPAQPPNSPDYRAWPDVDPARITADLVQNGRADGLIVASTLKIQC